MPVARGSLRLNSDAEMNPKVPGADDEEDNAPIVRMSTASDNVFPERH